MQSYSFSSDSSSSSPYFLGQGESFPSPSPPSNRRSPCRFRPSASRVLTFASSDASSSNGSSFGSFEHLHEHEEASSSTTSSGGVPSPSLSSGTTLTITPGRGTGLASIPSSPPPPPLSPFLPPELAQLAVGVSRIHLEGPSLLTQPQLMVVPDRPVNFTNNFIKFTIQLVNYFGSGFDGYGVRMKLRRYQIEGTVISPSGRLLRCEIGHVQRNFPQSPYDTFAGSFRSTYEAGVYKVEVRLQLPGQDPDPGAFYSNGWAMMVGSGECLVSRNYLGEARYRTRLLTQADVPTSPIVVGGGGGIGTPTGTYIGSPASETDTGSSISPDSDCSPNGSPNSGGGERRAVRPGTKHCIPTKAWGLSCDRQTNKLFFADRGTHMIYCVDVETGTRIFQGNPCTLLRPTGVAVDEFNRRLIVSDKDNHRICFFSLEGQFLQQFGRYGHHDGGFHYPWDVAVSRDGSNIVVADSRNHRIQLFDRWGNFQGKYSVFERNPYEHKQFFDSPRGITFNLEGSAIYVTDFSVNNVLEIPKDMSSSSKMIPDGPGPGPASSPSQPPKHPSPSPGNPYPKNTLLRRPQGIVMDELSGLLICDSKNDCIRHMTVDSHIQARIQGLGRYGFLNYPVNITMLGGGKVAVLAGDGKIYVF